MEHISFWFGNFAKPASPPACMTVKISLTGHLFGIPLIGQRNCIHLHHPKATYPSSRPQSMSPLTSLHNISGKGDFTVHPHAHHRSLLSFSRWSNVTNWKGTFLLPSALFTSHWGPTTYYLSFMGFPGFQKSLVT